MNIKKYLFFAVLALLIFSTPGSAEEWEITFEDHPYDAGTFAEVITGDASFVAKDNTHQLYSTGYVYVNGYTYIEYHDSTFIVNQGFDTDLYMSFVSTVQYPASFIFTFYDEYDNSLGSSPYLSSSDLSTQEYVRIHINNDDGSLTYYVDNSIIGTSSISTVKPISYFSVRGHMTKPVNIKSAYLYYYTHLDDISTSPYCIGHKGYVKPADNIIYFTTNTPEIDGYSYYVQMCDPNGAEVKRWNITSFRDTCNYTPAIDLTDDGLYYLYIYGQDDKLYYSKPFLYTSATVPADMIFKASGTVNADIRDALNQGGEIESGGERYLYLTEDEGGNYPINVTLLEEAFSFEYNHDLVYAMHNVNSSLVTFEELQSNYQVTLDGQAFPGATAATGSFTFSGNLSDGDILNISTDCYEFDNNTNTTPGTIPVTLNASNLTISTGNLLSEIETNGTADISANLTISEGASGGTGPAGFNYSAEITITDPSDQEGYQTAFNISQLDGMQYSGGDIRFYAENGTKLSYWINYYNSLNGSYYVGYVATPANATKINLYYGNGTSISESNGDSTFEFFDDFEGVSVDGEKWASTGTVSVSGGVFTSTGGGGILCKSAFSNESSILIKINSQSSITGGAGKVGWNTNTLTGLIYTLYGGWPAVNNINALLNGASQFNLGHDGSDVHIYDMSRSGTTCKIIQDGTLKGTLSGGDSGSLYPMIGGDGESSSISVDWVAVRKCVETEPTLTIGTPEPVSTTTTATLSLTANTIGTAGNLIALSANASNISASGPYMTGGIDSKGYTNGASTWSYNITDWTTTTEHIFEFSPDLTKPGVYGYVKDPDTQQPLRTSTVTIFNDSVSYVLWTDSNGMYYKTTDLEAGQTYSVKAAKSGYATFEGTATTKTGATTRYDFFLSPEEGAGLYYAVHDVGFQLLTWYGTAITDATVELYEGNGTEYDTEAAQTGITDGSGKVVFHDLDKQTRYKIIFSNSEGILYTAYEYPIFDFYSYCISGNAEPIDSDSVFSNRVNYGIYASPTDATTGTINVTVKNVEDTYSIPCTFNISSESGELLYSNSSTLGTTGTTGQYWNYSQSVPLNATYTVHLTISHPSYAKPRIITKTVNLDMGVDSKYAIHGWNDQWKYQVLVVLAVLMISLLASRWDAHIIAALVPFVGGLFMMIGWYGNSIMGLVMILYAVLHYSINALSKGGSRTA